MSWYQGAACFPSARKLAKPHWRTANQARCGRVGQGVLPAGSHRDLVDHTDLAGVWLQCLHAALFWAHAALMFTFACLWCHGTRRPKKEQAQRKPRWFRKRRGLPIIRSQGRSISTRFGQHLHQADPSIFTETFPMDFCSIPGQLNKNFNERPELVQIVNMPCAIFVEKPEDETLEAFSRRLAKPCGKLVSKLETPQATVGESMILIMQASSKCVVKAGVNGSKLGPSWSWVGPKLED